MVWQGDVKSWPLENNVSQYNHAPLGVLTVQANDQWGVQLGENMTRTSPPISVPFNSLGWRVCDQNVDKFDFLRLLWSSTWNILSELHLVTKIKPGSFIFGVLPNVTKCSQTLITHWNSSSNVQYCRLTHLQRLCRPIRWSEFWTLCMTVSKLRWQFPSAYIRRTVL